MKNVTFLGHFRWAVAGWRKTRPGKPAIAQRDRFGGVSLFSIVAAVVGVLAGCGGAPDLSAPQIRVNQDTCSECGMMISDKRHAAAIMALRDGLEEKYLFDDTGEMLEFAVPAGATEVRKYVHDFATGTWVEAAGAHFVEAKDLKTPMGTGVVAYAQREEAEKAAAEFKGRLMSE